MSALYNEWEPYAAQWIRNLAAAGHVAPGVVDERSIKEIQPDELGNGQVHLFAGIAIWSHALRAAGFPDEFPVWSASFPCQPFSAAGRGAGVDDPRHLWPDGFRLIKARRPILIVGEQVASKDGLAWLDLVFADLEGAGYACWAGDFCAAGFGAPHIRQRLYWVAIASSERLERGRAGEASDGRDAARLESQRLRDARGLGNSDCEHAGRHAGAAPRPEASGERGGASDGGIGDVAGASGATNGHWADVEWLPCRDGKWRPAQLRTLEVADGATGRLERVRTVTHPLAREEKGRQGRLKAYGNGLVAPQAVEFLQALKPCVEHLWRAP